MGLDVKFPIGLLFTIFGILLLVFGFNSDPAIYAKSLGVNINLRWGGLMLAFGIAMLLLSGKGIFTGRDEP
jgi:hypothetical protein